mgnify:CR=1 FL=1
MLSNFVLYSKWCHYTWSKTIRRVQETLNNNGGELNTLDQDSLSTPAALAVKQKRLTFTWLDGEAQQVSFSSYFSLLLVVDLFKSSRTWIASFEVINQDLAVK